MTNPVRVKEVRNQEKQQILRQQRGSGAIVESNTNNLTPLLIDVGRNLRDLRAERELSIRSLAELSGLNVNTLSMIENGKSSPSVSTLQQLASALTVPITDFFETALSRIMSRIRRRVNACKQHSHMELWQTWEPG